MATNEDDFGRLPEKLSDGKIHPPVRPILAIRCIDCFYVLNHLPEPRCPECGRVFDPNNPHTYTIKPPFVWWRYWLPGCVLSGSLALLLYVVLIPFTGFGWSVTIVVPLFIGGLVGYSVRLGSWAALTLAWLTLAFCLVGLAFAGFAGVFCTLILIAMALVPLTIGVVAGVALRANLKTSKWDQRWWLPVLFLLAIPVGVATVELQMAPPQEVTVETTRIINSPLAAAWDGVMFYEEVRHEPPWLLRYGLRTPLRTVGRIDRVGDCKVCIYSRGHLTKQVTARDPLKSLDFAVVEQDMFEDYSVRLTSGSFRFAAIDANHTRVTLVTRYKPLLHPRFAWQPAEEYVVHLLHDHVLEGMALEADRRAAAMQALADPAPMELPAGRQ